MLLRCVIMLSILAPRTNTLAYLVGDDEGWVLAKLYFVRIFLLFFQILSLSLSNEKKPNVQHTFDKLLLLDTRLIQVSRV